MNDNPMAAFRDRQFRSNRLARTSGRHRLIATIAVLVPPVAISCSGPQPLSTAIRPNDERAYVERLNAANYNGRAAFLAWKSDERRVGLASLEKQDQAMSETKNPFDAYKDFAAVSHGAVIYKYHCARCHGEDGRGRGPSALPGHPANDFHSFGNRFASTLHRGAPRRWFKSIFEGCGNTLKYPDGPTQAMPAFGDKLAREQIWLVITYLQSLDAKAPPSGPPACNQRRGEVANSETK